MSQPLFINADTLIRWDRARLASDSTYVNAGTCTWALKDGDGATIASGSLSYVSGTHGRWQGAIDRADVDTLTEGAIYWLEITLSNGSGADGFRRVELEAQYQS